MLARGEPAPAAAPNNAPDARDPELWGILFELRDGVQRLEVGLNAIIDRLDNVDDQIRRIETRVSNGRWAESYVWTLSDLQSVNAAMSILRRPINRLPPPAGAVAALPVSVPITASSDYDLHDGQLILQIDFVQCPTRKVKDLVGLSYEALHATGAAYGLVFQENARREDMAEAIWRYLGGQRLGVY